MQQVDELTKIKGIGPATVRKLKEGGVKSIEMESDEIRLAVEWLPEWTPPGFEQYPAEESGGGILIGRSDDPRLWGPMVRANLQMDQRERRRYESLTFFMDPKVSEGKTLFVNGEEVGVIQLNLVPGYGAVNAHQVAKEHLDEVGDIEASRIREVPAAWMDSVNEREGFGARKRKY